MINRIKAFFEKIDTPQAPDVAHGEKHIASAALLVEAANMDGILDEAEEKAIRKGLKARFDFTQDELDNLMNEALKRATDANQLLRFTQAIKDGFSYEERIELIEMLWEVAYADGRLHHYEANLLRRIGGLIYVSDRDRGEARKRVLLKIQEQEDPEIKDNSA